MILAVSFELSPQEVFDEDGSTEGELIGVFI